MKLEIPRLDLARLESLKDELLRTVISREGRPLVVLAAAAVLGLGVWYFAFAQPAAARLAALKARHAAAQRQLAGLRDVAAVEQEKARVAALETRVRGAIDRMSQDIQLVQILKQLASHAARYQIVVERLEVKGAEGPGKAAPAPAGKTPESEKSAPPPLDVRTQRIELELSCSYESAARFVDDLKTLPALVIVDKLEIEREPTAASGLKVLLTLKVHSVKHLPEELKT